MNAPALLRPRSGSLFVLVCGLCLTLSACSPSGGPSAAAGAAARPALTVRTESVNTAQMTRTVPASGGVFAWQEASVGAELQGLRIAQVNVNVGDRVRRGQVLARLVADTVRADLAQQEAAVADAQAALAQARANAARAQSLEAARAVSSQDLLAARTAESSAAARLKSAQAALANQQWRLARTEVVAPDDGTISARNASVGQVTSASSELFRLVRGDRIEWRAELSASALLGVQPGQRARVTLANGAVLEGLVRQVAPTLDATTRNGLVYVDLPAGSAARPGMFVSGEILQADATVRTVPGAALVVRDGKSYVMTADASGKVSAVAVVTGQRDDARVEIVEGLPAGEVRVITQGAGFLNEGDLVKVVAGEGDAR